MKLAIPDLVARFGPIATDRQFYLAERLPAIASGGFDLDVEQGILTLQPGGSRHAVQVIGTAAQGMWLWGWANPSFKKRVTRLIETVRMWGVERGLDDLANPNFPLEEQEPRAVYTGFACAAVAAGMTSSPGIYCCNLADPEVALWVAFVDDKLHEPPTHPLLRIATRYPRILALSGQGGLPVHDWRVGLESYAAELGVACEPHPDDTAENPVRILRHDTDTLVARFVDGNLSLDLSGIAR